MDDEADAFELRRVLDEAKADEALREQWQRFHLIRDLMQKTPQAYAPELRDALWERLMADHDEQDGLADVVMLDSPNQAGKPSSTSRWGTLAGGAIAATVALLVVMSGDLFSDDPTAEIAENLYVPTDSMRQVSGEITAADRQRRNAYYLSHTQTRAMNQIGVASFTKLVTFDEERMARDEDRAAEEQAPAE